MSQLLETPHEEEIVADRGDTLQRAKRHLFNGQNASRYTGEVTRGVAAVSARILRVEAPFTGISAGLLHPEVTAVDLDSPLTDAAAALDELRGV